MSAVIDRVETPAAPSPAPPAASVPPVRRLLPLLPLALLALLPVPFGDFGYFLGAFALVYAMIGLSVVVVSGYAGLISLMPYSFAGIGAVTAGVAVASWGWPFWLAVPLAALATVPVSLLVGIASVRLKGLYLAMATLTFANALGETVFRSDVISGGVAGWAVPRPSVGPISLASDGAFYVVCLLVVAALLWMADGLRTSRVGRTMTAVRDNETEAKALGINTYKTKLVALLLGGALAGIGGAFLVALLGSTTGTPFRSPVAEINSFLLVTTVAIGGIDRPAGAFIGAICLVVQQQVFGGAVFFTAFLGIYTAILLIVILRLRPGGLVEIARLQAQLIRRRPVLGIVIATTLIAVHVGVAILFVRLS
jgi:branched-chain amino acid transport system permease protein